MENQLYIDLMKKVLLDLHRIDIVDYRPLTSFTNTPKSKVLYFIKNELAKRNYFVCTEVKQDIMSRIEGRDQPQHAESMIGLKRMENIEHCVKQIVADNIPGDFIETGVWRGGAVIFMNALIQAYRLDRNVWVADSFEGLPKPDGKYIQDENDTFYMDKSYAISLDIVKKNFKKYDLLTENVKFLKGWFKDTLPTAPIQKLSLMRLDGDMYESTMDALVNLYPKLSAGGFIIIDDWNAVLGCQLAVKDFRKIHNIKDELMPIDGSAVYWRKG